MKRGPDTSGLTITQKRGPKLFLAVCQADEQYKMVWLPLFSLQFHHASHPGYGSARPAARNPAHPFPPHQALPFLSRPVASKMEAEYPHHQAGPSSATTTTTLWPYATRRRKRGEDGDDEDDLSPASVAMDLDADAQRAAVRASPPIIHPPRVTPRLELLRDYLVDRFGSCWIGWTDGCLLPVILVPGAARGFLEDWGHPVTFLRVGAGPRVWTGGEAAFRFFGWGGGERRLVLACGCREWRWFFRALAYC